MRIKRIASLCWPTVKGHTIRPIVFLQKHLSNVPSKKMMDKMTKAGRVQEIAFTRGQNAKEIGRLILASFPALLGKELSR